MWPGVLPRSSTYLPRARLAADQIRSRGTDSTRSRRHTRSSSARAAIGVGHVLEHLDGQHQVEGVVGERAAGRCRRRRRSGPCRSSGPASSWSGRSMPHDRAPPASGPAAAPAPRPRPRRPRARRWARSAGSEASRASKKPSHEPALDRVLRRRTCRRCCRWGRPRLAGPDRGHDTVSSARLGAAPRAVAGGEGGGRVAGVAGGGLHLVGGPGGPADEVGQHADDEHLEGDQEDEQGVDGDLEVVGDHVVAQLGRRR